MAWPASEPFSFYSLVDMYIGHSLSLARYVKHFWWIALSSQLAVFPRLKILPISFEILEGPKRYIIPLSAGVDSLLPSLPRNCNHILDYPCTWTFLLVQVKSIVLDRKVGVQFVNHKYDYRLTSDDTKSTYQLPSCEVVTA